MVVGPERETCGEEEIGYSQVQDESVGDGFEILVLGQNHNDQDVAKQTEDHNDGEESWDEDHSSLHEARAVTLFSRIVRVIFVVIVDGWTDAHGSCNCKVSSCSHILSIKSKFKRGFISGVSQTGQMITL